MAVDLEYPHIEQPVGEAARLQRLPRVRVAQIAMDYLAHGWSAEEMCRQHPYLTPAEIHSAMAFYFDHQQKMDSEIRAECSLAEKGEKGQSPFVAKMKSKGPL